MNASLQATNLKMKWDSFNTPCAIGMDANRFDQHVSTPLLEWEHSVYVDCVPLRYRRKMQRILKWQLKNRVYGSARDGTLKYTVEGTRMSGDANTSLGNCLLMCAIIFNIASHLGIRISLANNGDDCVLIIEKQHEKMLRDCLKPIMKNFGFLVTIEPSVYIFEKIVFCQCQPVFDGIDYTMVRDPLKSMSKDLITVIPLPNQTQRQAWMRSVGMGGMSLTGGLPVLQEFYSCMIRSAGCHTKALKHKGLFQWGLYWLTLGMRRTYKPVTTCARVSFELAFDISVECQMLLEQQFKNYSFSFCRGSTVHDARLF